MTQPSSLAASAWREGCREAERTDGPHVLISRPGYEPAEGASNSCRLGRGPRPPDARASQQLRAGTGLRSGVAPDPGGSGHVITTGGGVLTPQSGIPCAAAHAAVT